MYLVAPSWIYSHFETSNNCDFIDHICITFLKTVKKYQKYTTNYKKIFVCHFILNVCAILKNILFNQVKTDCFGISKIYFFPDQLKNSTIES
jgi:hypothetical protein